MVDAPTPRYPLLPMLAATAGAVATLMFLRQFEATLAGLAPDPTVGRYAVLVLNISLSMVVYTAITRAFGAPGSPK